MNMPNDSELKVMDVLWSEGDTSARRIAEVLCRATGWQKNTTYTLINRLIAKQLIERIEPGFMCRALIMREQVQQREADALVDKLFSGSASLLFSALVSGKKLPRQELDKLSRMIDEMK